MSRQHFTEEQIILLRQNPYVYSVTGNRLVLTKEFKEIFISEYNKGELPRSILENHGFDVSILGDRRIWGISQHIREEYKKYGEFHDGYRTPIATSTSSDLEPDSKQSSQKDEIKQLRHEVEYLKQEIEFLKKISSIRGTQK